MQRLVTTALLAGSIALAPLRASAGADAPLTLERALALARERAPLLLVAGARIEEARGRLAGASVLLRDNPRLEADAGRRFSQEGDTLEAAVGVRQELELGGQRGARVAAARAGIERAEAARGDALQQLLREVALDFYRALHAEEALRLAAGAEEIASEVARIAERRHRAEEVAILDVNVSLAALARARAERRSAEATRAAAQGSLRIALGLDAAEPLRIAGELAARRSFDLADLLARASGRADLRALEAAVEGAGASLRLARGEAWPGLGLGARWERDERDDLAVGELSLELPVFERAQGLRAEAGARERRRRLELKAARRAAAVEVRTAFAVHAQRVAAVEELERGALPLLDANEALARRSYEVGEAGLAELLLVRRETLDTRREYLERRLEAAVAAVDLEASAGVLE